MTAVFLRNKSDIVGYAKYVSVPETGLPSEVIHGSDLRSFAKKDEHLVAIYGVQIFLEFIERSYPYRFHSFEDLPLVLGDLNTVGKSFQEIIAWDQNKLKELQGYPIPSLGPVPKLVSAESINSLRDNLRPSPTKVRFSEEGAFDVTNDGDIFRQSGIGQGSGNPCEPIDGGAVEDLLSKSNRRCKKIFENSDEEVIDLTESDIVNFNDDNVIDLTESDVVNFENFDESIDQFEFENELVKERDARAAEAEEVTSDADGEFGQSDRNARCDEGSVQRYRIPAKQLSPAKKIILSMKRDRSEGAGSSPAKKSKKAVNSSRSSYESLGGEKAGIGSSAEAKHVAERHSKPRNPYPDSITFLDNSFDDDDHGSPDVLIETRSPHRGLSVRSKLRKRGYRFKNRRHAAPKSLSKLKRSNLEKVRISYEKNPFETYRHCCNDGCYSNVNQDYTVVQYRRFLLMDKVERKRALKYMYNRKSKKFWFDGTPVCSRFMVSLSFSNQLQSAVKGTAKARASASVLPCPRDITRDTTKDKVIRFLANLAGVLGDANPARSQLNLPLLAKNQAYERFLKTYSLERREHGEKLPTFAYFCKVWKEHCPEIKTHRLHGFTVCSMCEKFRSSLAKCESAAMENAIRAQMNEHYNHMAEERRGYAARVELAKKFSGKYLSIIVDGADQKSYGLPHFVFNTKEDQGHKIKVKCVGVLEHGLHKHLSLFTMTEEFESGANHVLEAIHRALTRKKSEQGKLPEVLFIQADNCTRENKNRFFLGYCQMLVAFGVFVEVQVSFLPTGHTHADIDQAFSTVTSRLSLFDAITMEDMLNELNQCYSPRASSERLDTVANFSGLCQNSGCLLKVSGFSQFRYFRFTRKKVETVTQQIGSSANPMEDSEHTSLGLFPFPTTCDVKIQFREEWSPMDNSSNHFGFLKCVPNLRETPKTDTTPPDNILEVNKHLHACEERIESEAKLNSLRELRDKVYTRRIDRCHWDFLNCYELNGDYRETFDSAITTNGNSLDIDEDRTDAQKLGYTVNFFLAVKTEERSPDPFWICRTLRIAEKDDDGQVRMLKVRWYEAKEGSVNAFSARYKMSSYMKGAQRMFFDDTVDVRSVICQFESLTQTGCLHIRTQKAIRQCLNLN